jgi:hypothetical protein
VDQLGDGREHFLVVGGDGHLCAVAGAQRHDHQRRAGVDRLTAIHRWRVGSSRRPRCRFVADRTYIDLVTGDLIDNFLTGLEPTPRAIAARVITSIHEYSQLTVGIKWRQLTFAVDDDFDHWICAVAANPQCVRLVFHCGSMLDEGAGVFERADAKFVRKMAFVSIDDVDDAAIRDLLTQALDTLPRYRERVRRRGLAGPARRRS